MEVKEREKKKDDGEEGGRGGKREGGEGRKHTTQMGGTIGEEVRCQLN